MAHNHIINDIKLGEHWLSEFDGFLLEKPSLNTANRDYTLVSIPGRSGDVYLDNGRYKNVDFTLQLGFKNRSNMPTSRQIDRVLEWLCGLSGYVTYIESFRENQYTKATITDIGTVQRLSPRLSSMSLKINRLPYWYDLDGAVAIPMTSFPMTFRNPTQETAEPIYRISCYSSNAHYNDVILTVNGANHSFSNIHLDGSSHNVLVIDCQSGVIEKINESSGTKTTVEAALPANLKTGNNTINVTGLYNAVPIAIKASVTPNWRRR